MLLYLQVILLSMSRFQKGGISVVKSAYDISWIPISIFILCFHTDFIEYKIALKQRIGILWQVEEC